MSASKDIGRIRSVPDQDGMFAIILWYVAKTLFRSQECDQFAIKSSNLFFDLIDMIVRTIRYISDSQHLNIICFISYSE